jgi:hypothetical protein
MSFKKVLFLSFLSLSIPRCRQGTLALFELRESFSVTSRISVARAAIQTLACRLKASQCDCLRLPAIVTFFPSSGNEILQTALQFNEGEADIGCYHNSAC